MCIRDREYIQIPRMDVEDIGFFLEKIPGTFYRLGVSKDNFTQLHTTNFYVDEEALNVGLKVQLKIALEYLC